MQVTIKNRLEFIEETHSYFLDSKPIPSVTQILSNVGLYPDFQYVDPWYAERGTRVHKACHYLDLGTLDWATLRKQDRGKMIIPYVESYQLFKQIYEFETVKSESRLYDENYWYAGTADKFGTIMIPSGRINAIIDLKCGSPEPGYQYQLAGYSAAEGKHHSRLRFGVYLKGDGSLAEVREYKNGADYEIFRAACLVYHARKRKEK